MRDDGWSESALGLVPPGSAAALRTGRESDCAAPFTNAMPGEPEADPEERREPARDHHCAIGPSKTDLTTRDPIETIPDCTLI